MHRSPTIREVAAEAQVSTATVSNVIHGKATLYSAETARVVWRAVDTLGYRPNGVARSLVRRRTQTLGVIIDRPHGRLTRNMYMCGLLDGFLESAVEAGYQIKLISLLGREGNAALSRMDDGSVAGFVLFAPPQGSALLNWAHDARVPVVIAGSAPECAAFASADVDDEDAGYRATQYLVERGHDRIGLVAGPIEQWSSRRREAGFRRALAEAEIAFNPEWRHQASYVAESADAAVDAFLQTSARPTALLCWNVGLALRALTVLRERGVDVPDEMSLIGFDDSEAAQWARPALTVAQQPVHDIGCAAANLLVHQIETGSRDADRILFPVEITVRESVAVRKGDLTTRTSVTQRSCF